MNDIILRKVALRFNGVYLNIKHEDVDMNAEATKPATLLLKLLYRRGYSVTEELLHALYVQSDKLLKDVTLSMDAVLGLRLNWVSLVRRLAFIEVNYDVQEGQYDKMKKLRLMTDDDMKHLLESLLTSTTPLDATQRDVLSLLLGVYGLPSNVNIKMRETVMLAVKGLLENGKGEEASVLLATPTDVLRYLWYEKTGQLKIIEPKALIGNAKKNYYDMWDFYSQEPNKAAKEIKKNLKLKYDRKTCRCVAQWLNNLPMSAEQAAENMNPKRGMWVRMIRALRLGEYSRKKGMERLAKLMDVFYNHDYITWQSELEFAMNRYKINMALGLLQQRPGLFARCLFATMLRFRAEWTLAFFDEVSDKVPARLLLSLVNNAEFYFDPKQKRIARPITGGVISIKPNPFLDFYGYKERKAMEKGVMDVCLASMERRFRAVKTESKTIYIDPALYKIPVSVGDRSETVQDIAYALPGTRIPVKGDKIRVFMEWGKGLKAQHLDMDLSCRISGPEPHTVGYFNLSCFGAKHSGDIRSIPNMLGVAEYIDLDLKKLDQIRAEYVTFTCNSYTGGCLSPNLVVGWMNAKEKMQVSERNGVSYNLACVQHAIRIGENNLSKGLVFGVLDVPKREIIWMEMPFPEQTIFGYAPSEVKALIRRLEEKLTIGKLLEIKAKAQLLDIVQNAGDADESYTYDWALNPADVSKLLDI